MDLKRTGGSVHVNNQEGVVPKYNKFVWLKEIWRPVAGGNRASGFSTAKTLPGLVLFATPRLGYCFCTRETT